MMTRVAVIVTFVLAAVASAQGVRAQPTASEVTFTGACGLELKGTLLLPEAAEGERVPAAVLLPGSGPPDRDGNIRPVLVTNLLKQIAEALAAEGIATVRFDKRSAATYREQWPKDLKEMSEFFSWENFTGDVLAAYRFLREQPRVDPARTAIIGHSEGGLLTLQVVHNLAGTDESPAAIVLLATAGRRLDDVVRNQIRDGLIRQGANENVLKLYTDATERAIAQVIDEGTVPTDLPLGLNSVFNPSAAGLLRSYFTVDPAELGAAYEGPVLVLQGAMDVQVLAEKDAPRLEGALRAREKGEVQVVIVPATSHNLKAVEKMEDPGFTGPVVPEAMEKLVEWVRERLAAQER